MKTFSSVIILFLLVTFAGRAQTSEEFQNLTLSECIAIALENNIDLKRAAIGKETARIEHRQTKSRLLPNVNGRFNYGTNNGRSIDPFTNSYIDQKLNFSNIGLSLENQLFNGFEILNSIQRDKYNLSAAKAEEEQAKQSLILDVAIAYYQILNNADLLELTKLRLQTTKQQASRLETMYEEGEGNPADYNDIVGQLKNDESIITDAEARVKQSRLELKQLLNIEEDINLSYQEREGPPVLMPQSANEVYLTALEEMPMIDAWQFRIQAAEENISVAKSLYVPRVSFFAQLNSNYSSLASLFTEGGTETVLTGQYVTVDGVNYNVLADETQFTSEAIPYLDQLNNNLNTVIGLAVDIPIFNGFRARKNVNLRKLEYEDSKLELENAKNNLETEIKTAYNLMSAAYKNYNSFQQQVASYEKSFGINEVRFQNGVSNFVEYIVSKNNLDAARINLRNSYYEYLIRKRMIQFYMGVY